MQLKSKTLQQLGSIEITNLKVKLSIMSIFKSRSILGNDKQSRFRLFKPLKKIDLTK